MRMILIRICLILHNVLAYIFPFASAVLPVLCQPVKLSNGQFLINVFNPGFAYFSGIEIVTGYCTISQDFSEVCKLESPIRITVCIALAVVNCKYHLISPYIKNHSSWKTLAIQNNKTIRHPDPFQNNLKACR